jgi:hypothetical protein
LAQRDDFEPHARQRMVRARALARRGNLDGADDLLREAAEIVEPTEYVIMHIDLAFARADVNRPAGRKDGERHALERAIEVSDAKGNRGRGGAGSPLVGGAFRHDARVARGSADLSKREPHPFGHKPGSSAHIREDRSQAAGIRRSVQRRTERRIRLGHADPDALTLLPRPACHAEGRGFESHHPL